MKGHTAGIEKIAFNPVRDAELASCSADGTVCFWDVRTKSCVSRLDVGGEAFSLSWSADGNVVLVGRKVCGWNVSKKSNATANCFKDDTLVPISVPNPQIHDSSMNGTSAAAPAKPVTSLSSPSSSSVYAVLEPHPQPVQTNATTFSYHIPSSSSTTPFFATTGEGTVKIISYPSFDTLYTLHAHSSSCLSIALAPTARYLAIGGSDALISLWDTTDWACRRTVSSENGGAVRDVSWSFDGRFICGAWDEAGCGGHGLEIFHAESGDSVYTVPVGGGPNTGIPAVAWHPSRYWLAYSTTADAPGGGGLRIIGAAGGGL